MIMKKRTLVSLMVTLGLALAAASSAEAATKNGCTSPACVAAYNKCVGVRDACYGKCKIWYPGNPAEQQSCGERTCNSQFAGCMDRLPTVAGTATTRVPNASHLGN
jgi:hypothetical protein